jgi:hypothetical protein
VTHESDYTDAEIRSTKPITRRVFNRIRRNAGLMRWADVDLAPGSLADDFWNKDIPRLLRLAEEEAEANG